MNDGSKPLENSRHERFACELAKGLSQSAAYVAAGYEDNRQAASRLGTNVDVLKRSEWIKRQAASGDVLTIAEKRKITAQIARAGEKDTDRLKAIQVDNDLAGDGAEAKGQSALAALVSKLRK
jgi:hypothetical protein